MSVSDYSVLRTRIELNNLPSYITYFSIQGIQLIMEVGYNTRNKRRWLALRTVSDDILLQRTFISNLDRVVCNVNTEILGATIFVVLEPKNPALESDDYLNWRDNFWLTFVSNDIEYDEAIDSTTLDLYVGGRA